MDEEGILNIIVHLQVTDERVFLCDISVNSQRAFGNINFRCSTNAIEKFPKKQYPCVASLSFGV